MRDIEALEVRSGQAVRGVFDALRACLAGGGPLLLPHAPGEPPQVDDAVAGPAWSGGLAVGTSGSTGAPKRALLSPAALTASATATHEVLGGPARWLLALPGHHIAGLQVILRSLAAGHVPAVAPQGHFTPELFLAACRQAGSPRPRYTSLVPTQLARLLADGPATAALGQFDAVLVGGAATAGPLLAEAAAADVRVVTTYGMSETAGGCIYDGIALPGVRLRLDDGRIELGGPTLADGYLDGDPVGASFVADRAGRWFRTGDRGRIASDGRLVVEGRADDVIVTGALKVWPAEVENALAEVLPTGRHAAVLGVPDPDWGQAVAVVLAAPASEHSDVVAGFADVVSALRRRLPAHALPRRLRVVTALPLRGPGKPDRAALRALFDVEAPSPTWKNES